MSKLDVLLNKAILITNSNSDIKLNYEITEKKEYKIITLIFIIKNKEEIVYKQEYKVTSLRYKEAKDIVTDAFKHYILLDILCYGINNIINIKNNE